MILSSKKNKPIRFLQASFHRYLSDTDYGLVKTSGYYHIVKGNKVIKWEPLGGFKTVRAAEIFLDTHDYIGATEDVVEISADDFAYVLEAYNFKAVDDNKWVAQAEDAILILSIDQKEIVLNAQEGDQTSVQSFISIDDLILALDQYYTDEDIYSSKAITVQKVITAAINVRDLARNLVRVKSSNIWAYGMNLRDRKDKAGEVVVQFKGDKGGPGDVYIYYDVPLVVWRKWLSATSKGHYFWMYIRNTYMYSKLTGDKRGKLKNAINR